MLRVWFRARHRRRLERRQQSPRLERRTHISVNTRGQGPLYLYQGRRRIPPPQHIHTPLHIPLSLPPPLALTHTLTSLQPASDDAPPPMSSPPAPPRVLSAPEDTAGLAFETRRALRSRTPSPRQYHQRARAEAGEEGGGEGVGGAAPKRTLYNKPGDTPFGRALRREGIQ